MRDFALRQPPEGSFNAAIQRTLPEPAPGGMTIAALPGAGDLPLYNADIQTEGFPKTVTDIGDAIRRAEATRDIIRQQSAGFEKFIRKAGGK